MHIITGIFSTTYHKINLCNLSFQKHCPPTADFFNQDGPGIYYRPLKNGDIRWNFEKFLINRAGFPVDRIFFGVNPMDIMGDIEALLQDPVPDCRLSSCAEESLMENSTEPTAPVSF